MHICPQWQLEIQRPWIWKWVERGKQDYLETGKEGRTVLTQLQSQKNVKTCLAKDDIF